MSEAATHLSIPNDRIVSIESATRPTVINRYVVPLTDRPVVRLPKFAMALSVGPPPGTRAELDLWAAVDPAQPDEEVELIVVGTGEQLPPDLGQHLGSVQIRGGGTVLHVFTVAKWQRWYPEAGVRYSRIEPPS